MRKTCPIHAKKLVRAYPQREVSGTTKLTAYLWVYCIRWWGSYSQHYCLKITQHRGEPITFTRHSAGPQVVAVSGTAAHSSSVPIRLIGPGTATTSKQWRCSLGCCSPFSQLTGGGSLGINLLLMTYTKERPTKL